MKPKLSMGKYFYGPTVFYSIFRYIAREVSRIEYFIERKNQDQPTETAKVTEQVILVLLLALAPSRDLVKID